VTTPLGARDAALRILEDVRPQPALRVPLDDALGSVLADDIASPLDIPAWTMTAALFERFRSRDSDAFYDKLLAAMRAKFGGHAVKKEG